MKNYRYILSAALLLCSTIHSEEFDTAKQLTRSPHRVYAGPDIFVVYQKLKYDSLYYFSEIASTSILGGLKVGYDYLKPCGFYFGTDGLLSMGREFTSCKSSYGKYRFKRTPLFANLEQRYGYTFQNMISTKLALTPFTGLGWYYQRPEFKDRLVRANWFYGTAGLRIIGNFYENFEAGFNFKAMYTFAGTAHTHDYGSGYLSNFWGYEVAMPLTWYSKGGNKWDFQLQPYLLKLSIDSNYWIYGTRFQIGYRI